MKRQNSIKVFVRVSTILSCAVLKCITVMGIVMVFSTPLLAQSLNDDPHNVDIWEKSQTLRDHPSTDTTTIEFNLGEVHYRMPRNYIFNMDNWAGGPQKLVSVKVTFPNFKPLSNLTHDCLTLAPLYRPQGCVPITFNLAGSISVSDDEGFKNASKLFRSQYPKQGPGGFEWYEEGPDTARLDIYRKITPLHTLVIECFDHDVSRPLYWTCNNHSRLPNGNSINYIISGSRYEFNGEQFKYAEQLDAGIRQLVASFTLTGEKNDPIHP